MTVLKLLFVMEGYEIIRLILLILIGYCLYRFIDDNILYNRARWFFMDADDTKLYNAVIRVVKDLSIEYGRKDLLDVLIEINGLDDFMKLKKIDRNFAARVVRVIERDKDEYVAFFKERGDI